MQTILQVEDDPNDIFLLQHAMKKVGLTNPVHVATNGRQAIEYLSGAGKFANREKFPLPSLVLLDLKLPFVMGLEVLKWIRHQPGPAPIVLLLTASAEEVDIATAYRLGANGFLTKPSTAGKLEDMAKAIKDFWLTQNTLPKGSHAEAATSGQVHAHTRGFGAKALSPVNGVNHRKQNHLRTRK
jgi:CheY-like chemotaxis protein